MTDFFNEIPKIKYEGQESENNFGFGSYIFHEIKKDFIVIGIIVTNICEIERFTVNNICTNRPKIVPFF